MVINQYDIFWVDLNPTVGHEIKKVRPCVVISPDEMNLNIDTVIIAPMTTRSRNYPTRTKIDFEEKTGWIVLDQLRAIDKIRLKEKAGYLREVEIIKVKKILKEILVD
ncbi:MAG: type II toxin-antitoxin system PemK/MazF family toxin [Actinobacteria bacterium]|jgi:mRNA interferase MazF|nr:type II toxin-antitoxin system PemK/MazF family toxin [Actinomycetota bacterium]